MTYEQWQKKQSADLEAARGVADKNGGLITTPGVARGQTYVLAVSAKGYEPDWVEVELASDGPPLWELDIIALTKR